MFKTAFEGRKLNASGILYTIIEETRNNPATDPELCRDELCEKYEHIQFIRPASSRDVPGKRWSFEYPR